jgi:hypothetical protein
VGRGVGQEGLRRTAAGFVGAKMLVIPALVTHRFSAELELRLLPVEAA